MEQKHFNTYKAELDVEFLMQYCMEHGEVRTFEQGEALENEGEPSRWVAYIDSGYFKYMVHNATGGVKDAPDLLLRESLWQTTLSV